MKYAILVALLLCSATMVMAQKQDLTAATREMGIETRIPNGFAAVPLGEQYDVLYQMAFRSNEFDFEVRCSFFSLSFFNSQSPLKDETSELAMFHYVVLLNIAQDENAIRNMPEIYKEEILQYYAADGCGWTMIIDGKSNFAKGYRYVAINMIYKKGRGLAYYYALMNDDKILSTGTFRESLNCMKFVK